MAARPLPSSHGPCALQGVATSAALGDIPLADRVLCAFQAYLFTRALLAPVGSERIWLCCATFGLFTVTVAAASLQLHAWIDHAGTRALLHRLGLALPVVGAYLLLRQLLPALGLPLADPALLQLDKLALGTTPALWLERFATPAVVEWFAFFYYGYYALVGTHLLLALRPTPDARSRQLLLGLVLTTCVGHALYTLVPGVGPYAFPGVAFVHELHGGFFFARVQSTVAHAGAHLDIFPSLHTAHPLFIALHALGHRRSTLYRYSWPVILFAAGNMIVATMLLRFHYGIDVVAGVVLAVTAYVISSRLR